MQLVALRMAFIINVTYGTFTKINPRSILHIIPNLILNPSRDITILHENYPFKPVCTIYLHNISYSSTMLLLNNMSKDVR